MSKDYIVNLDDNRSKSREFMFNWKVGKNFIWDNNVMAKAPWNMSYMIRPWMDTHLTIQPFIVSYVTMIYFKDL